MTEFMELKNNMDNNIIEVTGIPEPLLRQIDERVREKGGDISAYVRDLIERDIFGTSQTQKHTFAELGTKRPFDPKQWEADMNLLAQRAEKIPASRCILEENRFSAPR